MALAYVWGGVCSLRRTGTAPSADAVAGAARKTLSLSVVCARVARGEAGGLWSLARARRGGVGRSQLGVADLLAARESSSMLRVAASRLTQRAAASPGGVLPRLAIIARHKTSTGIVGLEVEPEAKTVLLSLYAKTLDALAEVPAGAEYRKTVEGMTKERLAVVEGTDDLLAIEKAVGCGQVEQLIQQAQDELSLIPKLVAARAFDPYAGTPAEEIYADLKRRGVALQRDDIPMRPSQDYPIESEVDLELPAPPEEKE